MTWETDRKEGWHTIGDGSLEVWVENVCMEGEE